MKFDLFPFQERARRNLLKALDVARYARRYGSQIISFTAPTGAGKTIIMAALVESIFAGDENYPPQENSIFVWLSDSPELNAQSKEKFYRNAEEFIRGKLVTIDETFNRAVLEDGKIYFLNTQKLSRTGTLTRHSDLRQYTIWETLQKTIVDKADRLCLIIDEAHRGMRGRSAAQATTIMQKFLKGSADDGMDAAPLIIGMSATIERFDELARGITSNRQSVVVPTEEAKSSGLLKERIIVVYPDSEERFFVEKDMAMLEAAADDWLEKISHWEKYSAAVKPIFIVQVQNGSGGKISETDLDECLKKICERTGLSFEVGEVVHTFGEAGDLTINGLRVVYEEPSAISGDEKVRVVFFKESLSTGWDCPRAETMMSFRRAVDHTYIAQLLGRMIRTPLQRRIESDDTLNDVRLFLPQFDKTSVKLVINELNSEKLPAEIFDEQLGARKFETLSVDFEEEISPTEKISPQRESSRPTEKSSPQRESSQPTEKFSPQKESSQPTEKSSPQKESSQPTEKFSPQREISQPIEKSSPQREISQPIEKSSPQKESSPPEKFSPQKESSQPTEKSSPQREISQPIEKSSPQREISQPTEKFSPQRESSPPIEKSSPQKESSQPTEKSSPQRESSPTEKSSTQRESSQPTEKSSTQRESSTPEKFSLTPEKISTRRGILEAINAMGLLSYRIQRTRTNDYLLSLFRLAKFLSMHAIDLQALDEFKFEMTDFMRRCLDELKVSGEYDSLKAAAKQFRLTAQTFDVFGKSVESSISQNLFKTTDSDIERQFLQAETKLKGAGLAWSYVNKFCDDFDAVDDYKIDVILFVANADFLNRLEKFAEKFFYELSDAYRRRLARASEPLRVEWDRIVSEGDEVSKHNFHLPAKVDVLREDGGEEFSDHLFVNKRGTACIKLNGWERGVLEEERRRRDFLCWLRNPPRASWSLCVPYTDEANETRGFYPDLIIIRREADGLVADVLEPHDSTRRDNLGKAKGLAKYARENAGVGRLELIRKEKNFFKRLDLSRGEIREKILRTTTNGELDNIFAERGEIS